MRRHVSGCVSGVPHAITEDTFTRLSERMEACDRRSRHRRHQELRDRRAALVCELARIDAELAPADG